MPIKTSLTAAVWLTPGTSWQKLELNKPDSASLTIASDFYVNIKEVKLRRSLDTNPMRPAAE